MSNFSLKDVFEVNSRQINLYFILAFLLFFFVLKINALYEANILNEFENVSPPVSESEIKDAISENNSLDNQLKKEIVINSGETLQSILVDCNISNKDQVAIINAFKKLYNPKKLKTGNEVFIDFATVSNEQLNIIKELSIRLSNEKKIVVKNENELGYQGFIQEIPFIKKQVTMHIPITNNMITSATKIGVPYSAILSLVNAFSHQVDFQRDIKIGNVLELVIDKYSNDNGKFSHYGQALYGNLKLKDREIKIYKFINDEGEVLYYDENGVSVKRQFLRTPVNAARISSGFGLRKHPILGYSRMHKGVDFAAPTGTPIFAAASGKVEKISSKGSYGNYIKVKHNNIYATAYAHMHKFAKGIKLGSKVKQGQIIGYVGNTGASSGPHLHFEVIKHGVQINPSKHHSAPQTKLQGTEMQRFKEFKGSINKLEASTL